MSTDAPLAAIQTLAMGTEPAMVLGVGLFGTITICVVVGTLAENIRKAAQTKQREQSRREIAAYIAEGTLSPDDGVRLMAAGESLKDKLGVKF